MNWRDVWRTKSETFVAEYLDGAPIADPDEGYLTVDIEMLRIADVRRGLTKFYGVVHSNIMVPYTTGENHSFQFVSSPPDLGQLDANHLDRVIVGPLRLLNGVPYRGGALHVEVGLFSIAAADLAGPYLKLLGSLSAKAGTSFVSVAEPFAEILHAGFQELAGGDTLEIGRSAIFDPPRSGRYLVVRATREEFPDATFSIGGGGRELLMNGKVLDRPSLLLHFQFTSARKDWFLIPELAKAYNAIRANVRKRDASEIEASVSAFRLVALTSPDLLPTHAQRLADQVETEFQTILTQARPSNPTDARAIRSAPPSRTAVQSQILNPKLLEAFDPFQAN